MGRPLNEETFTGAHPTAREFYEQLLAWGFTTRREDGVHLVLRGPHGGTVRLLRSLTGRAAAELVDKAARLADSTVDQFWDGPPPATSDLSEQNPSRRRRGEGQDSATSVVLAIHVKAGRPLGFDEVVRLSGERISRSQVRHASSVLCRDGDLDRVRAGVYQWAGHATTEPPAPAAAPAIRVVPDPAASAPTNAAPADMRHSEAVELFNQLFPDGVTMTADLFADLQSWTTLTERLRSHTRAS